MTEYIKKSDALNAIGSITMYRGSIPFDTAKWRIEDIPASDVREVVRGHWVKETIIYENEKYKSYSPVWKCSACGKEYDPSWTGMVNYCYNCGADMRGDRNG